MFLTVIYFPGPWSHLTSARRELSSLLPFLHVARSLPCRGVTGLVEHAGSLGRLLSFTMPMAQTPVTANPLRKQVPWSHRRVFMTQNLCFLGLRHQVSINPVAWKGQHEGPCFHEPYRAWQACGPASAGRQRHCLSLALRPKPLEPKCGV